MITGWTIYWIGILGNISVACLLLAILSSIGTIPWLIHLVADEHKPINRVIFITIIPIIFTLGAVFTPSTKHAAAIIVAPKIINTLAENKDIQQIPANITKLANDWIKELSPDKVKEKIKE